jgi:hypothetical protein
VLIARRLSSALLILKKRMTDMTGLEGHVARAF